MSPTRSVLCADCDQHAPLPSIWSVHGAAKSLAKLQHITPNATKSPIHQVRELGERVIARCAHKDFVTRKGPSMTSRFGTRPNSASQSNLPRSAAIKSEESTTTPIVE